jgi:dephospho-CoA kinase
MLFIDAPLEVRHARLVERQREGEDKITMDELKNKEELEMSGGSSQRLDLCKERADYIVENNGSIEELNEKIDKVLAGSMEKE